MSNPNETVAELINAQSNGQSSDKETFTLEKLASSLNDVFDKVATNLPEEGQYTNASMKGLAALLPAEFVDSQVLKEGKAFVFEDYLELSFLPEHLHYTKRHIGFVVARLRQAFNSPDALAMPYELKLSCAHNGVARLVTVWYSKVPADTQYVEPSSDQS
jgi:hypothetical protein